MERDRQVLRPPPASRHARPPSSPGVHAALSVLELLVAGGAAPLAELARELGIAKSTVHRILTVLVERGWAVRHADGCFDLGIRALGLGAATAELPIVIAFRGCAADLLTRHDETVCLAVLDGDESVFIALEETSQPVRLVTHVGSRTPAFASASGRVILATRRVEGVTAEFGGRPLVTPTGRRLRGVGELLDLLAGVRELGYAENDGDTAAGLYAASVPVLNRDRTVLAALTVCVPTCRVDGDRRRRLIVDLVSAGSALSTAVSWLPAYNATHGEQRRPNGRGPSRRATAGAA